jgi:hypothetical protein
MEAPNTVFLRAVDSAVDTAYYDGSAEAKTNFINALIAQNL